MTESSAKELAGENVFLVEDDVLVGMGLKSNLEELGATVTWSTTLAGALEALQSGTAFDIAIVDINLAGEMSTPVLDQLLGMGIYTIVCTGYDGSSLEERFQQFPRCEKPFTRAKLRRYLVNRK